jgi:hypothetical protein
MAKGIIYLMTTAVTGLIKIGKTGIDQYQERMRNLESNGYYNVVGLKRAFAIEVDDYEDKEKLLHEIFSKHQIANSELFALDLDMVKELLFAFEGKIVFPKETNKEKGFKEITTIKNKNKLFNFYNKGIKNGDKITFVDDETITAKVVGEREVEYEGQVYKLSPLVYKLMEQRGKLNKSGAYQGAKYFKFNGIILTDIKDKI